MPRYDTLCVDHMANAPPQLSDATKVWVNTQGFITHIGKGLTRWNAIDAGVFLLTRRIFRAIEAVHQAGNPDPNLSESVTWLIKRGDGLRACDVSGAFWMDVDTLEDLYYAEQAIQEREAPWLPMPMTA